MFTYGCGSSNKFLLNTFLILERYFCPTRNRQLISCYNLMLVIVSSVEPFFREVKVIVVGVSFAPMDLSLFFLAESEVG